MKKFIFFGIAAIAALASCKQVTIDEPERAISFEVASYMPQTRAQGNNFEAECGTYFFTNAWYTPASGDVQHYMDDLQISLAGGKWAPADAYYWPRSGSINFFSYASKNDLASSELDPGDAVYGTTFKITGHTVAADDNIMIADAVYNATKDAHNADGTAITDDLTSGTDSAYQGVPTMFRHLLAQISFNIGLATQNPTTGSTNFKAVVTNAELVKVANKGDITLTAGASGTGLNTQPWSPASDGTVVGWTNASGESTISLSNSTPLTLAAGASAGNIEIFLTNYSVLPQALSDAVVLNITFDLQTLHGTTVYAEEKDLTVSAKLNVAKNASNVAVASWNMNQRITYNVTIDPVTETVTFDPAVAPWIPETGAINYLVPTI